MKKILEMLGIDKLDESKQAEITEKFKEIVQLKVDEAVIVKETEIREQITEELETKFEQYKEDITEKFSDFVDEVINEECKIPDTIIEYARKGELYESVMETLKTKLAIDEGYIQEEVNDLLKECKETIEKQKDDLNEAISENMEIKKDAKEMAANLYIREKCEGLPLDITEKAVKLLEGVYDKETLDKKFDLIIENITEEDEINEAIGDDKWMKAKIKKMFNKTNWKDLSDKEKSKYYDELLKAFPYVNETVDNNEDETIINETAWETQVKIWKQNAINN